MSTLIIYTFVCETNKTERVVNVGDYNVTSMIDIHHNSKSISGRVISIYILESNFVSVIDVSF